jgi:hypothetical protein
MTAAAKAVFEIDALAAFLERPQADESNWRFHK